MSWMKREAANQWYNFSTEKHKREKKAIGRVNFIAKYGRGYESVLGTNKYRHNR